MNSQSSRCPENGKNHKTVLLVEDEVMLRITMADDLTAAGYSVMQADHADEALQILQTMPVDIVVTDITMPFGSMDGLALAEKIRSQWDQTKIIILSSHITNQSKIDAADLCLSKPGGIGVIADHVEKLLKSC